MSIETAVATLLNVTESQIVRVEEWAYVWFAVVAGKGGRFVSKRQVAQLVSAPATALPDPWESPIAPIAPTQSTAPAIVEPAFALLLPPAKEATQPNYQTMSAIQLRQLCTAAGIRWNRAGKGGKHLTKVEMVVLLTA